jgi:hypothetical protein
MIKRLARDAGRFGVFTFWVFVALVAGFAALSFLSSRFNSGILAPVGGVATAWDRAAKGS